MPSQRPLESAAGTDALIMPELMIHNSQVMNTQMDCMPTDEMGCEVHVGCTNRMA